jgi:hypothetical protein
MTRGGVNASNLQIIEHDKETACSCRSFFRLTHYFQDVRQNNSGIVTAIVYFLACFLRTAAYTSTKQRNLSNYRWMTFVHRKDNVVASLRARQRIKKQPVARLPL